MKNKYVKVKGHSNWFLVLSCDDFEPNDLSEIMQEKILRSEVCQLHHPAGETSLQHRLIDRKSVV